MKSCFNCRFCCDVREVDETEKMFRCSVPLPPWRFRAEDIVSTLQTSCEGGHDIPSGDAMAECCHYYDEAKP